MEGRIVGTAAFSEVIAVLLSTGSKQAVKYISPNLVVKATRKSYGGRPQRKDARNETLLVTFGKPNYREREFIALAKKVGEPFPIKRCQLRGFPGKRVAHPSPTGQVESCNLS